MIRFDAIMGRIDQNLISDPLPSAAEWRQLGLDEAKEIRQRTESRGRDAENKKFDSYGESYKKWLKKNVPKKNPEFPNLSLSAKMMGAIGAGVTSTKNSAKITLSGQEGMKAYGNEQRGRKFLGIPDERLDKLADKFGDLIFKKI